MDNTKNLLNSLWFSDMHGGNWNSSMSIPKAYQKYKQCEFRIPWYY